MKILVADDEELARRRIIKLLKDAEISDTIYESSSGKETIKSISQNQPDLVFLDIQMTDMTGFDVLKKVNVNDMPVIVFVTAFDNFAVKAFEVQALDFLLKPYKKERFFDALYRGIERLELNEKTVFKSKVNRLVTFLKNETGGFESSSSSFIDKIVLKKGRSYYFILIEHVNYICSSAYYAEIYTNDNRKHIYRISMRDFIKKLDPKRFARINRSTIINLKEIKEIVTEGQGDYSVIMNDSSIFSLSKNFKKPFLKIIGIK